MTPSQKQRIEEAARKHAPIPTGLESLPLSLEQQKQIGYEAGLVAGGFIKGAEFGLSLSTENEAEKLREVLKGLWETYHRPNSQRNQRDEMNLQDAEDILFPKTSTP